MLIYYIEKEERKMKMDKVKKRIINVFYAVFALLFLYLLINIIFFNNTEFSKVNFINLFIGIIVYVLLTLLFYKIYNEYIKNKKIITIFFCFLFICFQFIFSYIFMVLPSWDFGIVYNSVVDDLTLNNSIFDNLYFYRYCNNIGLAVLLKILFGVLKLLSIKSSCWLYIGIAFNILMIDISVFYLYKTLKIIFKEKISNFFLICTLFVTPFITYCPIFYTDTLSMPFIVAAVYYFSKYFIEDNKKTIYLILCGLSLGIGTCIKSSVIITLIAIIIMMFFIKGKFKSKVFSTVLIILVTIIPCFSLKLIESKYMDKNLLNSEKFPITHWIMMGLNEDKNGSNGTYSYFDVLFTDSFKNIKEKKKNNIIVIKSRINEMYKNHEMIEFYTKKAMFVWGDGTFYAQEKLRRDPIKDYSIKNKVLGNKRQARIYLTICQTQEVLFLIFIVLSLILKNKLDENQRKILLFTSTIIFGVFLFFLIWETRSRYIVNFIPIILIQVYLGVVATYNYLKEKRYLKNEN